MKVQYKCLPCIVNQAIKVADMTQSPDKDVLLKKVFTMLSEIDFDKTTPEIIGVIYRIIKEHVNNPDPYLEIRTYYNKLFLEKSHKIWTHITNSPTPFEEAIKYAIIGNIIDFNPIHNRTFEQIMDYFNKAEQFSLTVNHTEKLLGDIKKSTSLLYLGDNCGEICLDKLLIRQIKTLNPNLKIYFGVRGKSVINDNIEADAYLVGMDEYAEIISNGDCSLGTVLDRTSPEFKEIYDSADIIISKGQANYESLSEVKEQNIYFLLMTKCGVIANDMGVPEKALICLNNQLPLYTKSLS